MTDQEALQLHDRATRGKTLSEEEQTQLDAWYALQDRLDLKEFKQTDHEDIIEKLQAQIDSALMQLHTLTARIQTIASENNTLRQEIASLYRQLSKRTQFQAVR